MNPSPLITVAYAVTVVLLVLNLTFLWLWSGVHRARSGKTNNPEDGARFGKPVDPVDPPGVARVLRAHANAQATIFPFLFLATAYVLLNGNTLVAAWLFGAFVVLRNLHSVAYLNGWQPARSILYALSLLALLILGAAVVLRAIEVMRVV
ncbi:MAG: MAPEG family protein [Steroidobacteraceae bacterium]